MQLLLSNQDFQKHTEEVRVLAQVGLKYSVSQEADKQISFC